MIMIVFEIRISLEDWRKYGKRNKNKFSSKGTD